MTDQNMSDHDAAPVPVAWQTLINGRWCNLPEDWSPIENRSGQQYRALYCSLPEAADAQALLAEAREVLGDIAQFDDCEALIEDAMEKLLPRVIVLLSKLPEGGR
jgi:hypothetical protein